jgi:hypothetical protein
LKTYVALKYIVREGKVGAGLVLRDKQVVGGTIIEMVIWELSSPLSGCQHAYKYRLYCGTVDGTCMVRYDNERGKGDHKHLRGVEHPYEFKNIRSLIADFRRDVHEEAGL